MKELFKFCDEIITPAILKKEKWLRYLYITDQNKINLERLNAVSELSNNKVLEYVERTLNIAKNAKYGLTGHNYLIKALQWSEVTKCGNYLDRIRWEENGLNLNIHNEASAVVYFEESDDDKTTKHIVYNLIMTHGLIGQYIRGEIRFLGNEEFSYLLKYFSEEELYTLLLNQNHAIIAAVDESIWQDVEETVKNILKALISKEPKALSHSSEYMMSKLFPAFKTEQGLTSNESAIYDKVFYNADVWYPSVALASFTRDEINTIFNIIRSVLTSDVRHISFYDFSKTLFYDYEGKRKENVYKKRVIEMFLREWAEGNYTTAANNHLKVKTEILNDTLSFDIEFTPVCESLINFCVEAERSGLMDYQKNITTIFDLFGFRRDIFDRLNNEDKYLETMNAAEKSTKLELLKYVYGDKIVDVGSGGGVLLDQLESMYPNKTIIGTDISTNVIETLNKKIKNEGHKYSVMKHNFVDGPLAEKVDTIIFSSILHEVFSYTEYEGKKFNIESVHKALENAKKSLNPGGVILIRDGVLTDKVKDVNLRFKTQEGINFFKNYFRDFKGLPEIDRNKIKLSGACGNILTADIEFVKELIYTFTWGSESYACEVQEQFGYMTKLEFEYLFKEMGMEVLHSRVLTEPGYPEHLNDKVELLDFTWDDIPSTGIFVAKKGKEDE